MMYLKIFIEVFNIHLKEVEHPLRIAGTKALCPPFFNLRITRVCPVHKDKSYHIWAYISYTLYAEWYFALLPKSCGSSKK